MNVFNLDTEMKKILNYNYSLSDRQKTYESLTEVFIPNNSLFIIRLDGKTFSKRVKQWKLKRPFDERFNKCMIDTCLVLFKELQNVKAIWTGSDEISIILNPEIYETIFSGRLNKILSITSSIATSAFNFSAIRNNIENIEQNMAWFDSRIIMVPNRDEIINNIIFRQNDCIRNSISQYARHFYSTKELVNKGREEQLTLLNQKNFDWNTQAIDWSKYGILFYRMAVLKEMNTNQEIALAKNIIDFGEINSEKNYIRTKIMTYSNKFEFEDLKEKVF